MKDLLAKKKKDRGHAAALRGAHPFFSLQEEMNHLFNSFFSDFYDSPALGELGFARDALSTAEPRVDVSETDKEITVHAELPGMDEKDVEVTLDRNLLTIKGEKNQEREEKDRDYYLTERTYGHFQRVIPLNAELDEDKVDARFKKGVLTISIPKTAKAQTLRKKIPVHVDE